jgi:flagellar assembly protein FliH
MAPIIRSAVIAGSGRQLRRVGDGAPAPLLAEATSPSPVAGAAAPVADAHMPPATHGDAAALAAEWALLRQRQAEQQRGAAQLNAKGEQVAALELQLQAARRELDEGRAQALADAERRGLALGREQAEREVAEQIAAQGERINVVLAALNQSRRRALDEHEDVLVEIAFTAVCRMLGATAATRDAVAAMVRALVGEAREPAQLRIRLHPHDLALLAEDRCGLDPRLVLQADSDIGTGGCQIEGPDGTLDARLELQVRQLRATLLAARGAADKNEVPV